MHRFNTLPSGIICARCENVGKFAVLRELRALPGSLLWLRHGCDVLSVDNLAFVTEESATDPEKVVGYVNRLCHSCLSRVFASRAMYVGLPHVAPIEPTAPASPN